MSPFRAYGGRVSTGCGSGNLSTTRFRPPNGIVEFRSGTNVVSAERRKKLMIDEEKKYKRTTERYYNNYKNRPSSLYKSVDTNNSTERTKTAMTAKTT